MMRRPRDWFQLPTPPLRTLLLLGCLFPTLAPLPLRAVAPQERAPGPGGEIHGLVRGRHGGTPYPLPHVHLTLSRGMEYMTVVTDAQGRYRIRGLREGRWRVDAVHLGHATLSLEVLVPGAGSVEVDIELRAAPIPLSPLRVRGKARPHLIPREEATQAEVGEVALRSMEGSTGMVEGGVAQVVRAVPGGDEAEPTDVLLMRGSAADLKLVLLDGAPVYTPFHLGGLVESFDPGALGEASLFLGGAPARFDGGLSYILDLHTRSPRRDRFRVEAAADLLTGRLRMDGPVPGGGVLISSRLIHAQGTPVLNRSDSPYGYRDLLFRGEWGEGEALQLFFTGFTNQEEVRLELGSLSPGDGATWGNLALSGGLRGRVGEGWGEIRGAVSRYDASLPVSDSIPLFARSQADRVRITADLTHPWRGGVLRAGVGLDRQLSDVSATGADPGGGTPWSSLELRGTSGGAYLEGDWPLGNALTFRGGLRVDHFSGGGGLRAAPRAALSWLLAEKAVLTLAAGRYHQFSALSSGEVSDQLAGGAGTEDGAVHSRSGNLTPGAANHLVVSLDQILTQGLRLGVEGYMKSFSDLSATSQARVNASGLDIRVAREGDRASGWVGYTLSWFWAAEEGFLGGDSRFSGRHLLSAGLSALLTPRTGVRLRLGYGDGLPYTSVPLRNGEPAYGPSQEATDFEMSGDNVLNQAPALAVGPDEGFLRVEGEVYTSWTTSISGRQVSFSPYLRVLNALDRRDALFYHFDPWRDPSPRPLAELPVLPLIGLQLTF